MELLLKLYSLLPLKLKRRINSKLVDLGLKDAPKPRKRTKKSASSGAEASSTTAPSTSQ